MFGPKEKKAKYVRLPGVGEVLLESSKRAKRLSISVRSNKNVRVAVPLGTPMKKAEEFVHSKSDWIRSHLRKLDQAEQRCNAALRNSGEISKDAAKQKLVGRLDYLAGQHGFTYNRVFIRSQRTRWGSCSAQNNISLNIKLAKLPDRTIDYVILHELVHTRIKNHSKAFWDELGKHIPNIKKARAELNQYRLDFL